MSTTTIMQFIMTDEQTGIQYFIQAENMVEALSYLPSTVNPENVTVTSHKVENPLNIKGLTLVQKKVTSPWLTLFE